MPRPETGARAAVTAAMLLGWALTGCSPSQEGPTLTVPDRPIAAEARFGERYCRRLESPETLDRLVDFARAHAAGWQATWSEPPPPQLAVTLLDDDGAVMVLGIGDGQLRTRFDSRTYFKPLGEAARRDLVGLVGGPPTGAPEIPCGEAGEAAAPPP